MGPLDNPTPASLDGGGHTPDGDLADQPAVVAVSPGGHVLPYRKSHLYPTERDLFAAGTELVVAPTPAGLA
jgi:predicted amidohydrolase